jgi:serine/threonine-protein phosphatase 4 regulatory subunit 2
MNDESLATAVSPAPLSAGLASPAGNSAAAGSTNSNSSGKNDPDANLEEVLLELTSFEKEISKAGSLLDLSIPSSLESYLKLVANAGSAQFPWTKINPLFRVKLEQVIHEFNTSSPTSEIPAMPNVDAFNFDAVKGKVFEQLEAFVGIPFTVQRLAELLTTPRRHYRRTDKFMRALEKNMLVSLFFCRHLFKFDDTMRMS